MFGYFESGRYTQVYCSGLNFMINEMMLVIGQISLCLILNKLSAP